MLPDGGMGREGIGTLRMNLKTHQVPEAATVDVGNGQPRTVRAVTVVHHVVG